MATSSVFPLEIYERILEHLMDGDADWGAIIRFSFIFVCTAWRWKCRALGFRYMVLYSSEAIAMMLRWREKFAVNPQLIPLVEDVELRVDPSRRQQSSLVETFPYILGRFLPRLRRVIVISQHTSAPPIHPHFAIRRIQLHTVTVLDVGSLIFDKSFTFGWLVAPFPSLRVLDLYSVCWQVAGHFTAKEMPPLVDLVLRLRGSESELVWIKDNQEAHENLLSAAGQTLRSLTMNLFPMYILTSLRDSSCASDNICLNALEELTLEVHAHPRLKFMGKDGKEMPYRQCITDMVAFLRRLDAKKTRILNLSFETDVPGLLVSDEEFVDHLHIARKGLEDLVVGDHFPSLQVINIYMVGTGGTAVPIWQERFDSSFPLLADRRLLRVKEHIAREKDLIPRHMR